MSGCCRLKHTKRSPDPRKGRSKTTGARLLGDRNAITNKAVFTCISYAEARNRYRLDVRPSVCLSVCLSVCPSVTRWHPIKTAEYIVMLSSPHDSPFILVLCISRCSRNSDGVTPCWGAKYRWGIKFARFSTNKSLYLANDTKYRYGRRIGTHTRSIKWCHFQ